jgi:hypothetical protein
MHSPDNANLVQITRLRQSDTKVRFWPLTAQAANWLGERSSR